MNDSKLTVSKSTKSTTASTKVEKQVSKNIAKITKATDKKIATAKKVTPKKTGETLTPVKKATKVDTKPNPFVKVKSFNQFKNFVKANKVTSRNGKKVLEVTDLGTSKKDKLALVFGLKYEGGSKGKVRSTLLNSYLNA